MRFREIATRDDARLAAIVRAALEEHDLALPGTVYYDAELDHLSEFYLGHPAERHYLVAVDEADQVLGGVGLAPLDWDPACAELQKLYVSGDARRAGLGRALVERDIEQARAMGYERMYLETHTNLAVAIELYRKCGFREIPRPEQVKHGLMNVFMAREL